MSEFGGPLWVHCVPMHLAHTNTHTYAHHYIPKIRVCKAFGLIREAVFSDKD